MTRRHYRIGPAIWDEPWDDDTKLVAFYVLTSPHRTTEGLFRMPLTYAVADMGWQAKRFMRCWTVLVDAGFVSYDDAAQVCWIRKALSWQKPANPNQVTGAVKALRELPSTPLLEEFAVVADRECEKLGKALREAMPERFANRSETVSKPLAEPVGNTPSLTPSTTPPYPLKGESPDGSIDLSAVPPSPPTSGRQREKDAHAAQMSAWADQVVPEADPAYRLPGVSLIVSTLKAQGHEVTARTIREYAASGKTNALNLDEQVRTAIGRECEARGWALGALATARQINDRAAAQGAAA